MYRERKREMLPPMLVIWKAEAGRADVEQARPCRPPPHHI